MTLDAWAIEYWDGDSWEPVDAFLNSSPQELNGQPTCKIQFPNNSTNRTFVASNQHIRVKYGTKEVFNGYLYGSKYTRPNLSPTMYDAVWEDLKKGKITADYSSGAQANTILSAICTAAGITAGSCPTTTVKCKFISASTFDAVMFLWRACNDKDIWSSSGTTINIGTKGTNRSIAIKIDDISDRETDRSKQRNHAIARGKASDGSVVEGHAYVSGGTVYTGDPGSGYDNYVTFSVKETADQTTLENMAAQKLRELMSDSASSNVNVPITQAYIIDVGDTLQSLSIAEFALSGDYRVYKVTYRIADVGLELGVLNTTLTRTIEEDRAAYEDQGIYIDVEAGEATIGSGTSFPGSPEDGQAFYRSDENVLYRYDLGSTQWIPIVQVSGEGTSFPGTPQKWDYFFRTDENKLYQYNGASWVFIASTDLAEFTGDIGDITDIGVSAPNFTKSAQEVDSATQFRTWIRVTITRDTDAGGYIVGYRINGSGDEWKLIPVDQPSSGNPIIDTPDLLENTTYDIRACAISMKGQASAWSSAQTQATSTNDTAPGTLTGAPTLTAVMNGIIVDWSGVLPTIPNDFHHYEVYAEDATPPTEVVVESIGPYAFYKHDNTTYGTIYVAIKLVDTAGNASTLSSIANTTPLQAKPLDLQIELRPWTSNVQFSYSDGNYDYVAWTAGYIKFADETAITINSGSADGLANGLHYFYYNNSATLAHSQTYTDAVGQNKALIAIVYVTSADNPTILPFNSYAPTIGAGVLAAELVHAAHLVADEAVITASAQIQGNLLVDGHISASAGIAASKILIYGTTYLDDWRNSNDLTTIDGGQLFVGSEIILGTGAGPAYGKIRSGQTAFDTGTGWWLGSDAGTVKLSIGNPAGNKLTWNGTTLAIVGSITIQGGSGIANLTDAGALATEDDVDFDTEVVDGSTYKKVTVNEQTGAQRAYADINASGNFIGAVAPGHVAPVAGAGLYLGSDYLGYYDSAAWKVYIKNDGNFLFKGDANNQIEWNGTTLTVTGKIVVQSGSSGIASFSDAGPLVDATDLDDIPDGSSYEKTTPNEVTGAGRAFADIDASGNFIGAVDPGHVAPVGGGAGLYLGSDYLGYYTGSAWQVYIANTGNFLFKGNDNNKIEWNGSTLTVVGSITIQGGSGISNLSDAGALATEDNVDLDSEVIDGSTYKKTTANEKTGAGRAYTGLDSSNRLVTAVLPGTAIGTPGSAGLYLGSDKMGYYNSGWKAYIQNDGDFYFGGDSGNYIEWNGSILTIHGKLVLGVNSAGAEELMNAHPLFNMVLNGSFEIDSDGNSVPDGWGYGQSVGTGATFTRDASNYYAGAYGAKLYVDDTTDVAYAYYAKHIPIHPLDRFVVKGQFKGSATMSGCLQLGVFWYAANKTYLGASLSGSQNLTTTWAEFEQKVTAPSNAYWMRPVFYNHTPSVAGSVFADDFLCVRVQTASMIVSIGTNALPLAKSDNGPWNQNNPVRTVDNTSTYEKFKEFIIVDPWTSEESIRVKFDSDVTDDYGSGTTLYIEMRRNGVLISGCQWSYFVVSNTRHDTTSVDLNISSCPLNADDTLELWAYVSRHDVTWPHLDTWRMYYGPSVTGLASDPTRAMTANDP